jgi:hypothetical protein
MEKTETAARDRAPGRPAKRVSGFAVTLRSIRGFTEFDLP